MIWIAAWYIFWWAPIEEKNCIDCLHSWFQTWRSKISKARVLRQVFLPFIQTGGGRLWGGDWFENVFIFYYFFLFLLGGTSIHAKESSSTSGGCSGCRLRLLRWRVFHLRRLLRWRLQWRQWNDWSQQWSTHPGFWSCAGRPGVRVRFSFCWGTFRLCVGCYPVAWPKSGECGGC